MFASGRFSYFRFSSFSSTRKRCARHASARERKRAAGDGSPKVSPPCFRRRVMFCVVALRLHARTHTYTCVAATTSTTLACTYSCVSTCRRTSFSQARRHKFKKRKSREWSKEHNKRLCRIHKVTLKVIVLCARVCELREHVCLFVEWDSEFVSRVEV